MLMSQLGSAYAKGMLNLQSQTMNIVVTHDQPENIPCPLLALADLSDRLVILLAELNLLEVALDSGLLNTLRDD